ncbi:MAG TPA: hypothetical protein VFV35_04160 [Acidimicrobiales bacterium]|nr:hypothetical protein [Acidimicrobiales bacterium]
MARAQVVESRRDRKALARDAGLGSLSFTSALAGMLCAFGAFAVAAAIAAALLDALGVDSTRDISGDWRDVGVATGIVLALVLFVSYLFGGYVAGRMARRAGARNGLLAFALGIVVVAVVGAALGSQTDMETVRENLRSVGVPTNGDEWTAIGSFAGVAALAAMFLGAILGGVLGERWHGKLLSRALDPSVGPNAGDASADVDLRDRADGRTIDEQRAARADGSDRDGAHFRGGTDTSTTLDEDLARRRVDDSAQR